MPHEEHDMVIDLKTASPELLEEAAEVLLEAFLDKGIETWKTMDDARKEVAECLDDQYLCWAWCQDGKLAGWGGLRPMYARVTWELHPMAIRPEFQGRGIGRLLLAQLESQAHKAGALNIMLGTDDETGRTSLYGKDFTRESLFDAIESIANRNYHPYAFYRKCGYMIVGVIPDANGIGKHDIWMWKRIAREP